MEEQYSEKNRAPGNEIDLLQMLLVIWRRKWFILTGTLVLTLIAVLITYLFPQIYKSSGFINSYWPYRDIKEEEVKLKKVNLDDFGYKIEMAESKKIIKLIKNKDLFNRFLRLNADSLKLDKGFIATQDGELKNSLKMIFAIAQSKKKTENKKNFVIGFQITTFGKYPKRVEELVFVLKEYISRIIINNEIVEYIKINLNWEKYKLTRNKSRIINCRYDLEKLKERETLLFKLSKEFSGLNNSQVIVSAGKSKVFQTPLQQLISIKIEIADMNEKIERIIREDIISGMRLDLLVQFNKLIADKPDKLIIFDMVGEARGVFASYLKSIKDNDNDFLQMVKSEFEDKLAYFDQLGNYVLRLSAKPSVAKPARSVRKKTIVSLTFLGGLLFFIFIAFIIEAIDLKQKKS